MQKKGTDKYHWHENNIHDFALWNKEQNKLLLTMSVFVTGQSMSSFVGAITSLHKARKELILVFLVQNINYPSWA